jgi:predicted patatin/cPLA2 family phospholipase
MIGYTGVSVGYKYYPATGIPDAITLTSTARNEVVRIVVIRPLPA